MYMRTIMTTADNFKAKGIQQVCLEFYDFKNPTRRAAVHT